MASSAPREIHRVARAGGTVTTVSSMAYSAWKPTIVDRYTHWVDSADVEHTIFRAAKAGGPPERLKTNAYTYARSFAIAGAWINFNDGPRLYKVAR